MRRRTRLTHRTALLGTLASVTLAAVALGGCSQSTLECGEGTEPVIVTGLNGTLDGAPAVELIYQVPMTCEGLDRAWMFWDDPSSTLTIGDEPTMGTLSREGVEVDDRSVFFRDVGVGVRLEYPEDVEGPELALVWFGAGEDLATVDCAGDGETMSCAQREE